MPTLSGQILAAMSGRGHTPVPLRVARGELIALQDGRGRGVYLLSCGRMKVLRFSDEGRVILLDLVEPGDVFGELSFLSEDSGTRRSRSDRATRKLKPPSSIAQKSEFLLRLIRYSARFTVSISEPVGDR